MDYTGNLIPQPWRNRVADLAPLCANRSLENVIIWEGLQPCGFADGQASHLGGVVVDEVVPILRQVACDS